MVLEPIPRKRAAHSNIRVRDKSGGYTYQEGGKSPRGSNGEMSPSQKRELERKNRIQQKIADFRMLKYQQEQDKLNKQEEEAEKKRKDLEDAATRRNAYMESQKKKLQIYKVERALKLSEENLLAEEQLRKVTEDKARRMAG